MKTRPDPVRPQAAPEPRGVTRRELGRLGLTAAAVLGGLPLARHATADEPWVSDLEGNAALLGGVQYVPRTAKPDQRCGNCILYRDAGSDRGKCALFQQGVVPAEAWCVSWGPRPS